jgi:CheY-like chemotaxis protein
MRQTPSEALAREVIERDVPETIASLERWALVREKVLARVDVAAARKARGLMADLERTRRRAARALEREDRPSLVTEVAALGALLRASAVLLASRDEVRAEVEFDRAPSVPAARVPVPVPASPVASVLAPTAMQVPPSPGIHVLVVDDDDAVRNLAARALRRTVDVEAVGSAADARRALERRRFDAIVSDLDLGSDAPGSSGADLLAEVAAKYPAMRRVLFTGSEEPDASDAAIRARCDEVRYKSGGVLQLVDAVLPRRPHRVRPRSGIRPRTATERGLGSEPPSATAPDSSEQLEQHPIHAIRARRTM